MQCDRSSSTCCANNTTVFVCPLHSTPCDRLYVHLDSNFEPAIRKIEQSLIKCFLVVAVKKNRRDKASKRTGRMHGIWATVI